MTRVAEFRPQQAGASDEWHLRVDLTAASRRCDGWHESVASHFSLAVSPDGKSFLMNPRWRHFSRIRPAICSSSMPTIDRPWSGRRAGSDGVVYSRPDARGAAQARHVPHPHPPYATALAALADPEIKPVDQNTARFFNPRCL